MRTAFMARPSRASISPSPIGAGEQRGRHFKAERTPDWLDRPWEDEQQLRMRLRPLEIKVSVNYARLCINIVRLAKGTDVSLCPLCARSRHFRRTERYGMSARR